MLKNRGNQILILVLIGLFLTGLYFFIPDIRLSLNQAFKILSQADVKSLRLYLLSFGIWAPIISGCLMILQSIIAPLPAFVITFTNGLLFGVWWGTALSWSSAMIGAAICFAIAKVFGRPVVERLVGVSHLQIVDAFFTRYGAHAILLARLIPLISFDAVSYGSGLTAVSFWHFIIATGIGQLPATVIYSYLGESMTGTVRILFWIFVLITSLIIVAAILKPYFEKRLLTKSEDAKGI